MPGRRAIEIETSYTTLQICYGSLASRFGAIALTSLSLVKNRHIIRYALDLTLTKLDVETTTEDLLCQPIRRKFTLLVLNSFAEKIQRVQTSSRDADVPPVGMPEQKGAAVAAEAPRDVFGLVISFDL